MNAETETGARNRAAHAKTLSPGADMYVIIENGIFEENKRYIDKAVVLCITRDGREEIAISEGVEFPNDCVEEARRRGFKNWTAGKIMQERGLVADHADPHASLGNKKPRTQILTETVASAFANLLKWTGTGAGQTLPRQAQAERG